MVGGGFLEEEGGEGEAAPVREQQEALSGDTLPPHPVCFPRTIQAGVKEWQAPRNGGSMVRPQAGQQRAGPALGTLPLLPPGLPALWAAPVFPPPPLPHLAFPFWDS